MAYRPVGPVPEAGRPNASRREPLWDRVDANKVRLALFVALFVLAAVAVIDGFLAVFGGCMLLMLAGAIADATGSQLAVNGQGLVWLLTAGSIGAAAASLNWSFVALRRSEKWLLKRVHAEIVPKGELIDTKMTLKDMAIAAGLQLAPALYLIENTTTNAAVFAAAKRRAVVVVTRGFLTKLELEEQRAVFANLIARLAGGDTIADTGITGLMWPLQSWRERTLIDQNDGMDAEQLGYEGRDGAFALMLFGFAMAFVSELFAAGARRRQLRAAEKADAEGMLLLKDPRAMLGALERCVELDNVVPGAGETLGNLFYCWTGDSTNDEDDPEWERVARLREVLGVEGWIAPQGDGSFAPEPPRVAP